MSRMCPRCGLQGKSVQMSEVQREPEWSPAQFDPLTGNLMRPALPPSTIDYDVDCSQCGFHAVVTAPFKFAAPPQMNTFAGPKVPLKGIVDTE